MNLFEFEAKKILNYFNILIPYSIIVKNFFFLKNKIYKIQVHSGYRKKNNGVIILNNKNDCLVFFKKWLNRFFFKKKVKKILIENIINFKYEFYISFFINNDYLIFIISNKGGINIELQKKIDFLKIKIEKFFFTFNILNYLINCGLNTKLINIFINLFNILYKIVYYKKTLLIEINPLVIKKNNIFALDCKIILNIKNIENFSDKISIFLKINYLHLKGNISCVVNGAGLSLKILDLLSYKNGKNLNFIDLSGFVNDKNINNLFKFFLIQKKIKILIINLFGGIVSCNKILLSLLNLMYYDFYFKIILKLEGIDSKFVKKKLIKFKNLIIEYILKDSINKCIIFSNV